MAELVEIADILAQQLSSLKGERQQAVARRDHVQGMLDELTDQRARLLDDRQKAVDRIQGIALRRQTLREQLKAELEK